MSFFDDDVRFWQLWRNRSAAAEAPSAVNQLTSAFASPAPSTKGRHFLVICCENKAIFLDLVTMRGRDVPKQELDNKSLLWWVIFYLARLWNVSFVAIFYCRIKRKCLPSLFHIICWANSRITASYSLLSAGFNCQCFLLFISFHDLYSIFSFLCVAF